MMHPGQTKSLASCPPAAEILENCSPVLTWAKLFTIKDVYLTACSAATDNALPRGNGPRGTRKKRKKKASHATSLIDRVGRLRGKKTPSTTIPGAPKTNSFIYRAVGDVLWRRMLDRVANRQAGGNGYKGRRWE